MLDLKARFNRELEERLPSYSRTRESAPAEDEAAANKSPLKMKWIVVTENGKRQLRMQWSVRANGGARSQEFAAKPAKSAEALSKRSAAI